MFLPKETLGFSLTGILRGIKIKRLIKVADLTKVVIGAAGKAGDGVAPASESLRAYRAQPASLLLETDHELGALTPVTAFMAA